MWKVQHSFIDRIGVWSRKAFLPVAPPSVPFLPAAGSSAGSHPLLMFLPFDRQNISGWWDSGQGRLPAAPCSWHSMIRHILRGFSVSPVIVPSTQPEPETCLFCLFSKFFQDGFAFPCCATDVLQEAFGWEACKATAANFHWIGCCSPAFLLAFCY